MPSLSPDLQRLLDEALVLNDDLESLAEEGLAALRSANPLVRAFLRKMVRDGTGMALEDLREEIHGKTRLLAGLSAGEIEISAAQPALARYARLVSDTARFVEGLEPLARQRIRSAETRDRVEAVARTHLAGARRLAEVLGELTAAP